jgi:hypothetical protein
LIPFKPCQNHWGCDLIIPHASPHYFPFGN